MIEERFELATGRIREIKNENAVEERFLSFFIKTADEILMFAENYLFIKEGGLEKASLSELKKKNEELFSDIKPENYNVSYTNPAYAVACLGEEFGPIMASLAAEMRALIGFSYEQDLESMVIRMELFLEVYSSFAFAYEEGQSIPNYGDVKEIGYWFVSDYTEGESEATLLNQIDASRTFAKDIIMNADLSNERYLYYFGEYITDNEIKEAAHLNELPEEKIALMADTYTEGYRIGFEVGNKDISKKKTVNIRYHIGFERVVRKAIENFGKIGLDVTIFRSGASILRGRDVFKVGFFGANANKQFDFDHKEDLALFMDRMFISRRLEGLKEAYEAHKELAAVFGGPAVIEIFGEKDFVPENKKEACKYSESQRKLCVEYASKAGEITNTYIRGDERSFTIIAFPVPDIGDNYEEIFDEIVKINTLDYSLYQKLQQRLIDALDEAEYVEIFGMGENHTNLHISMHDMKNPDKETNFENCVSDVNIPVGEVFTSPKLSGTTGTLHVSHVFLNAYEFKDLEIVLTDGMVTDFSCKNFKTEEENKKYINDNIMFHHDSLPIGEFAIGTNTTAYVVSEKYGIADKLPILIAEKMGPHFAFGDTCYSHSEDVIVYNPDGKEIVAKENEVSSKRNDSPEEAYFNCHTDVTIPYDELGLLQAVKKDGTIEVIIKDGRFVLEGTEELNKPFEEK